MRIERDLQTCAINNLVIGGSIFPHKRTWVSPGSKTENQIDHICISKKFRRSLQDVRVRRGADIAFNHHLVVARMKLKLKKNWTAKAAKRVTYNISLLKDPKTRAEFGLMLRNMFEVLQELHEEEDDKILGRWQPVKEALRSVCQEVLGVRKHLHKEWITVETLTKI